MSRYIKEKIKSAGSDSVHKAGRESPLFCITQTVKGEKILIYSAILYIQSNNMEEEASLQGSLLEHSAGVLIQLFLKKKRSPSFLSSVLRSFFISLSLKTNKQTYKQTITKKCHLKVVLFFFVCLFICFKLPYLLNT